jgi:hypothetical protein
LMIFVNLKMRLSCCNGCALFFIPILVEFSIQLACT